MKILNHALIVATLLLVGCANKNEVVSYNSPNIVVEHPSIYKWLAFNGLNKRFNKDMLEFEANFKNTSSSNQKVAYKVIFKDADGFTQKTIISRWIVAQVEAQRSLDIKGIAPSNKIKDFEIILQEPSSDDSDRQDSYRIKYTN